MAKCIKCGVNFVGTPENPPQDGKCRYCECEDLRADNSKLRKALSALVGAESEAELAAMEVALRSLPGIEADKVAALNAIHALRTVKIEKGQI